MKKLVLTIAVLLAVAVVRVPWIASAAEPTNGQKPSEPDRSSKVQLKYVLHLPKSYAEKDSWPLLLFLHGIGERGENLERVKFHGPPKLIAAGKEFPFIVVSPQCPSDRWWKSEDLSALLDEIVEKYKVDKDRIYVAGLSMGGFGT
jgi:predicted peptidase